MKGPVIELLEARCHVVTDYGTHSTESVDFPDIAARVTEQVRAGAVDRGILVCGTGVGAAIAGNKTPGIRAAVCHDTYTARQCVEHDDVNLLCIGAWIIGIKLASEVIDAFLDAEFSTEPHFRRRVQKLYELELRSAQTVIAERS